MFNNAPSPQRQNVSPITAFTGLESTSPISTLLRTSTNTVHTVSDVQHERGFNMEDLLLKIAALQPLIQQHVQEALNSQSKVQSRGELPNFSEGDFVLVAREYFTIREKHSLRWRGPRRVVKAISDYVFQIEYLRNGVLRKVHETRLKFYCDSLLNVETAMSQVLASETGMPVQRLMNIVNTDNYLMVQVRWFGLPHSEDTLEPVSKVYEDVSHLFRKQLVRKNTPVELVTTARRQLFL